ncbi:MAG: helix-turn-helix domain-containing protein [Kiritimatiellia bacterium]
MAHLPIDFCRKVAKTRRTKGLTQSALARNAGCKQSAISMFESGHPEKLSMESVRKVAEILDITLDEEKDETVADDNKDLFSRKAYCPNAACLSNIPYMINGELIIWPKVSNFSNASRYCKVCGEVLEFRCPECGRDVGEGAFCEGCGRARITAVSTEDMAPGEWVKRRRAEIREVQLMCEGNGRTT